MPQISLLSFHKDYELIEVVAGLCTGQAKYCVSHYSALYWNELVEQRPTNYYLSKEAPNRKSTHTKEYDFDLIKQTFMKSPRHTIYCLDHEKNKIFLLEKVNLGQIGVIEKTVKVHDRKATFKLTNIERTLIDAVMAPQYSGGILTVIHAFESAKINLRDLVEVYNKYNPFYPYWQSIGLILEQTKGEKLAADWATNFGKIENKFFLDHQYKSNWNYSEKWKIYYPTGIFSSDN
jgi:predicted transcriptional regulator of viral defense system